MCETAGVECAAPKSRINSPSYSHAKYLNGYTIRCVIADRARGERDAYRQGNSRKTVIKLRSGEQKERGLLSVAAERHRLESTRLKLRDSPQRTPNLLTVRPKSVIWMLGAERYLPLPASAPS